MREGQNPAKFIDTAAKPEKITVAILTYIPFLSGYYAEYLEVLKVCLDSLFSSTSLPFDLMVFDNGSGSETINYLKSLHAENRIQFLLLSEKNLGKGGAWNIIFETCPGEILAYADSDALFYPGWLSKSVEILEGYPNVGMVTSRPFRTPPEFYDRTLQWARNEPCAVIEKGQFIPWQAFKEFDLSLAKDEIDIQHRYETTQDVRITYQGVHAFAGASHWQFVGWKNTLRRFLPFKMDRPMGQVKLLDQRVNEAGLLRLMTAEALVMNMSNTPIRSVNYSATSPERRKDKLLKRVIHFKPIKWFLMAIYSRIFLWYYSGK